MRRLRSLGKPADTSSDKIERALSLDDQLAAKLGLPSGPIAWVVGKVFRFLVVTPLIGVLGWLAYVTDWLAMVGPYGWFLAGLGGVVLLTLTCMVLAGGLGAARVWLRGTPRPILERIDSVEHSIRRTDEIRENMLIINRAMHILIDVETERQAIRMIEELLSNLTMDKAPDFPGNERARKYLQSQSEFRRRALEIAVKLDRALYLRLTSLLQTRGDVIEETFLEEGTHLSHLEVKFAIAWSQERSIKTLFDDKLNALRSRDVHAFQRLTDAASELRRIRL